MYGIPEFVPVYFSNVNVRSEAHGKELVSCCDIAVEQVVNNQVLNDLAPALKRIFFKPASSPDDDPELDGIPAHSDMPEVRGTAILLPITLVTALFGYRLEIDFGIGSESNIVVEDCKVNEFKIKELIDKGMLRLKYRIQACGLEPMTLGLLGAQDKHKPLIKLIGPSLEVQRDLQAANEQLKPKPGRPPKNTRPAKTEAGEQPDAGDIFAAEHAVQAEPSTKPAKVHSLKARMGAAMKKAGKGHTARP